MEIVRVSVTYWNYVASYEPAIDRRDLTNSELVLTSCGTKILVLRGCTFKLCVVSDFMSVLEIRQSFIQSAH
jgi:hypothetical protein